MMGDVGPLKTIVNPLDLSLLLADLSEIDLAALYELSSAELERRERQRRGSVKGCDLRELNPFSHTRRELRQPVESLLGGAS